MEEVEYWGHGPRNHCRVGLDFRESDDVLLGNEELSIVCANGWWEQDEGRSGSGLGM